MCDTADNFYKLGIGSRYFQSPPFQKKKVSTEGTHLIAEYWGVNPDILQNRLDIALILKIAAEAAGATILHEYFHHFGKGSGVTGFIALAESHISIHTWPEESYAALDVFMCGNCNPALAIKEIQKRFDSKYFQVLKLTRGNKTGIIIK